MMRLFCFSVAFFKTCAYTRFFSLEEALRIKSENGVDSAVFDLENIDIIVRLGYPEHLLKLGRSIFLRHMIVNLVNIVPVNLIGTIIVF